MSIRKVSIGLVGLVAASLLTAGGAVAAAVPAAAAPAAPVTALQCGYIPGNWFAGDFENCGDSWICVEYWEQPQDGGAIRHLNVPPHTRVGLPYKASRVPTPYAYSYTKCSS